MFIKSEHSYKMYEMLKALEWSMRFTDSSCTHWEEVRIEIDTLIKEIEAEETK
jgi:hypothetical protein